MELIKEIVIENPPTFYSIKKKRESEKLGYDVFDKHYLTANLFFNNNLSFFVVSKIIRDCKKFLLEKSGYIPPLEKMRLEIEIHASKHLDLDNRAYFWKKLFMDILKTPTAKQLAKASEKNREIITMNVIYDDSTQYVDDFRETFKYGGNFLIFRIYGRVKSEQKELDLFFK
jgi:hypothetical protein